MVMHCCYPFLESHKRFAGVLPASLAEPVVQIVQAVESVGVGRTELPVGHTGQGWDIAPVAYTGPAEYTLSVEVAWFITHY